MRSAIAITVTFTAIILLLLGCAAKSPATGANTTADASPSEPQVQPEQTPSLPSTLNLSFSRNASDVMNTDTKPFVPPRFDFTNTTTPDGRLIVNYFYSTYCSACKALRPDMTRLEERYGDVEWREFDITTQNGTWAYQQFANESNLSQSQRLVPQVLVNGTIITDRFGINGSLEGIISAFSAGQS
jgi:thiol-disulfide isomerase/thioredoxin